MALPDPDPDDIHVLAGAAGRRSKNWVFQRRNGVHAKSTRYPLKKGNPAKRAGPGVAAR